MANYVYNLDQALATIRARIKASPSYTGSNYQVEDASAIDDLLGLDPGKTMLELNKDPGILVHPGTFIKRMGLPSSVIVNGKTVNLANSIMASHGGKSLGTHFPALDRSGTGASESGIVLYPSNRGSSSSYFASATALMHEEGHRVDFLNSVGLGIDPNKGSLHGDNSGKVKSFLDLKSAVSKTLARETTKARYTYGLGPAASENFANYFIKDPREMFASNWEDYMLNQGRTTSPDMARYFSKEIMPRMPVEYRGYLANITNMITRRVLPMARSQNRLGQRELMGNDLFNKYSQPANIDDILRLFQLDRDTYKQFMTPHVPGFAKGGKVKLNKNKTFMVGERGPELINIEGGSLEVIPNHLLGGYDTSSVKGMAEGGIPGTNIPGDIIEKLKKLGYSLSDISKMSESVARNLATGNIQSPNRLGGLARASTAQRDALGRFISNTTSSTVAPTGAFTNAGSVDDPVFIPKDETVITTNSDTAAGQVSATKGGTKAASKANQEQRRLATARTRQNQFLSDYLAEEEKIALQGQKQSNAKYESALKDRIKEQEKNNKQNAAIREELQKQDDKALSDYERQEKVKSRVASRRRTQAKEQEELTRKQNARVESEFKRVYRSANKDQFGLDYDEAVTENKRIDFERAQRGVGYDEALKIDQRRTAALGFQNQYRGTLGKGFEELGRRDPRFLDPLQATYQAKNIRGGTDLKASFSDEFGKLRTDTISIDRFGNVVETMSRKFKSFGEQLGQNFVEITKWSLAVSLLYGPMQKLSELTTQMIENQTRLAQVAVTLGTSQDSVNNIFDESVAIARKTGVAVEGIIEGYNTALRSVGNVAAGTERFAKANELLTSSIILAKLSGMDQAQATDTLTAAYKQSEEELRTLGGGYADSALLLDKWVTVSRNANVDVQTLATAFAITAESAAGAGLSIDELNGFIATMAEKSITGARETGNAVRQIVAGYTTDGARKELERFGISVVDAEGKARGLKEVFADVYNRATPGANGEAPIISSDALNKIAYQIGGGSRGQSRSVLELMGFERTMQVAGISATAPKGAAEEAMKTLLDTIEGNMMQLNTSFTELAQTLGTSGGLLDSITGLVKAANIGVQALDLLTEKLGGGMQLIAAIGISSALFRPGSIGNLGSPVLGNLKTIGGGIRDTVGAYATAGREAFGQIPEIQRLTETGGKIASSFKNAFSSYAPAMGMTIAGGFLAAMRLGSGDVMGAGITMGSTIIGGMVGASMGLAPVGALIGSLMGEAYATYIENNKSRLAAALANSGAPGTAGEYNPKTPKVLNPAGKEIDPALLLATYGKDYATITANRPSWLVEKETQGTGELAQNLVSQYQEYQKTNRSPDNMNLNDALSLIAGGTGSSPSTIGVEFGNFSTMLSRPTVLGGGRETMTRQEFIDILAGKKTAAKIDNTTEYAKNVIEYTNEAKNKIESIQQEQLALLTKEMQQGRYTQTAYVTKKEDLNVATSKIASLAYPFAPGDRDSQLGNIGTILRKGTDEEVSGLTVSATSIQKMQEDLAKARAANARDTQGNLIVETPSGDLKEEEFVKKLNNSIELYYEKVAATLSEVVNRTILPGVVDFTSRGYDKATIDKIAKAIPAFLEKQVKELNAINPEYGQAFETTQKRSEGTLLRAKDGTLTFVQATSDLIGDLTDYMKKAGELVKDLPLEGSDMMLKDYTDPNSAFNQAYNRILAQAESKGYQPVLEDKLIYTKDKDVYEFLQKDARVAGLAREETNKLLEKQLNGVYNLPSGASFYVPYQAAKMSRTTEENMNKNSLFNSAVDKFQQAVDAFARDEEGKYKEVRADLYPSKTSAVQNYNWEDYARMGQGTYPNGGEKAYLNQDNITGQEYVLPWQYTGGILQRGGAGFGGGGVASYPTQADNESTNKAVSAKLELNIDNRVTLIANGRVLAEVIKPYLETDMVNFANSTTSRVSRSVGYAIGT